MVFPGVVLFDGWPARLGDAARCDSTVATASAMLLGGPWGPAPGRDPQVVAQNVVERSLRLRPRLPTPQAGCVLLRRRALDVAGVATDREATSPAADLAAFGERCSAMGLSHVLADDVLAAGIVASLADAEAEELDARWPHRALARELEGDPESPARLALLAASRGLDKFSVTIDGRALGPERTGTQVHALELIAALGRTEQLALRVLVGPDLDEDARRVLEEIEDLELLPYAQAAHNPPPPTDIVHRPSQVFSVEDLNLITPLGRRVVVTQQDLIQYRNPSYHQEPEQRKTCEHARR